ncbi:MAG: hypothetical protein HeimC3_53320 [Candidatus Heimdallarchaeota archaeon LC_3]|nr:MAG: hypothetical protein HeimC3_53320 [Candidatus Heimdallarchaeota archaeon LC_3]
MMNSFAQDYMMSIFVIGFFILTILAFIFEGIFDGNLLRIKTPKNFAVSIIRLIDKESRYSWKKYCGCHSQF